MKEEFKMNKRIISLLLMLMIIVSSVPVFAHALFLTLEEPGVLKAEYDGGGFSPRMEVTIYDKDDNELVKGNVDEEGLFHFDEDLAAHHATVDDGMGHTSTWETGVVETSIPKIPVVIGVFALIGGIFYYYSKKKK